MLGNLILVFAHILKHSKHQLDIALIFDFNLQFVHLTIGLHDILVNNGYLWCALANGVDLFRKINLRWIALDAVRCSIKLTPALCYLDHHHYTHT